MKIIISIIGLILFTSSAIFTIIFFYPKEISKYIALPEWQISSPAHRFQLLVEDDIKELLRAKIKKNSIIKMINHEKSSNKDSHIKLDTGTSENGIEFYWNNLLNIEYLAQSNLGNYYLKRFPLHIPTNNTGKFNLEIDVIDLPDDTNPGIILQFSFFDASTKNKKYELGRTYFLDYLERAELPKLDQN